MSKIKGTFRVEATKRSSILGFLSKPTIFRVYSDGVSINEKGVEFQYLWSELREYYHLEIATIKSGTRTISKGKYEIRLVMSDGREILLDNKFDRIKNIAEHLRNETVQPLLNRAKLELEEQDETYFGEYIVTNNGFRHQTWTIDKQITWDKIIDIRQMGPAYVIVYTHPEKPDDQAMLPLPPMNKLPNAGVLISLIQTFVTAHQQKNQE